mmetsp:Transcript_71803/g.202714  ORF Transcript_71803/g.202714 Transcript_71803/m.202714 type:complete len:487 (+) Transcript_71803:67-1527(+)
MWGTWGPRETWGWDDGVDTVREARRKKADEEKDRAEREVIRKAYFRLEQPVHGTLLQAYWPNQDTWLPVKFVKVCLDGKYRVKWCSDGTLSDMPTDYVRKHGSDEPAQGDSGAVTIRQVLVDARPDWKERDVEASLAKLKRIGIVDARNLHEVVKAEIRGGWGGVNSMLKEENEKPFLMQTLLAMRKCGEAWLMREAATSGGAPTSELSAKTSNSKVGGHNGGAKAEPQDPAHAANVRNNFTPAERERGGASTHPADPGAQASSMEAAIAAAAMANGAGGEAEAEAAQLLVRCARGHALEQELTPYDGHCDGCREALDQGTLTWRCSPCTVDLCDGCHAAIRQRAPPRTTAFNSFMAAHLHAIMEELGAAATPSLGALTRVCAERWRALPAEERRPYRGRVAPMTRGEFVAAGVRLRCALSCELAHGGAGEPVQLCRLDLPPRAVLQGGAAGWHETRVAEVPVMGTDLGVHVRVSVAVAASRRWVG